MSASDAAVMEKLFSSLQLLVGLRKASFRSIVQAREALSQVHLLIIGSSSSYSSAEKVSENGYMVEFLEAMNSVPMLRDFAGTALLQLQQQPVLQAPAADRATMIMIFEGLACALRLPSSTPATAKKLEQQTCEARTGANSRLYCCCTCTCLDIAWHSTPCQRKNTSRTMHRHWLLCGTPKQDICCRVHVAYDLLCHQDPSFLHQPGCFPSRARCPKIVSSGCGVLLTRCRCCSPDEAAGQGMRHPSR
jgi:hypothetical protein